MVKKLFKAYLSNKNKLKPIDLEVLMFFYLKKAPKRNEYVGSLVFLDQNDCQKSLDRLSNVGIVEYEKNSVTFLFLSNQKKEVEVSSREKDILIEIDKIIVPGNNRSKYQQKKEQISIKKLVDLGYTKENIINACKNALNDVFWTKKLLTVTMLTRSNKDGLKYIDVFLKLSKEKESYVQISNQSNKNYLDI